MDRVWLVSYGVLWLLMAVKGLALVAILWTLGRIHLRSDPEAQALITEEGPEIHSALPPVEGTDLQGRVIRSEAYRGQELVLLLLSQGCDPCETVLYEARALASGEPALLVVVEGTRTETESLARRCRARGPVIVDEAATVRSGLGVERTPYAFLVDAEGVVRMKGVVNNGVQLENLIERRGLYVDDLTWLSENPAADASVAG